MRSGRLLMLLATAVFIAGPAAAEDVIGPDNETRAQGPDDTAPADSGGLISEDPESLFDKPSEAYVTEVMDGDTIVIGTGEKVRYIGIDAPETTRPKLNIDDYYGKSSADFNRSLVLNKKVKLVYDKQLRDRYSRLLAYVYVGDTFINAELVRQGHALAASFPPNTLHAAEFMKLMGEAIDNQRGIWGFSDDDIKKHYSTTEGEDPNKIFNVEAIGATDGDTIMIQGGALVRMIGIDSPETFMPKKGTDYYGKAAHEFCQELVKGQKIRLEYDIQYRDPKKRLLAYVYVGDKFINYELVKNGYAIVAIFPPNMKQIKKLIEAQNYARRNGLGMWKGVTE